MAKPEPKPLKDQPWAEILAAGQAPEDHPPVPHFDATLFAPGTFGCHEAMHECVLLSEMLLRFAEHPAIRLRPEWRIAALHASYSIQSLHKSIHHEHIAGINKRAEN